MILKFHSIDTTYKYTKKLTYKDVRMFLFIRNTAGDINTGCTVANNKNTIDFQRKSCVFIELTKGIEGKILRTDIDLTKGSEIQFDLVRESFNGKIASSVGGMTQLRTAITKNKFVKAGSKALDIVLEGTAYNVDTAVLSMLGVVGLSHIKMFQGKPLSTTVIKLKNSELYKDKYEAKGRNILIAASYELGLQYISIFGIQLQSFDFSKHIKQPLLVKLL